MSHTAVQFELVAYESQAQRGHMLGIEEGQRASLEQELLALYDDFSEFEAVCAFFCDSVAALGATGLAPLAPASAGGLTLTAEQVKTQGAALRIRLESVRSNLQARSQ